MSKPSRIPQAIAGRHAAREGILSVNAVRESTSKGRSRPEPPHPFLSTFQLDRDRIVRSNAFRRLKHKTQVFIAPQGDHYLTRMTHTMEVGLLGRVVSRALGLNEDLAEAICMGHDVGHSPFGHLGEKVLAELFASGFRHNRQSVRVVEILENEGNGLNLTWEVRQGILRHSKARSEIEGKPSPELDTLEGQAAKIADALAYITHDTGDAIRAGVISVGDLPVSVKAVLGVDPGLWVDTLISDLVTASWDVSEGLKRAEPPSIRMSDSVSAAANTLREFLFERVYLPASATEQASRASDVIRTLYGHFLKCPDRIPRGYSLSVDPPDRQALDYVSGMTDAYALRVAETLKPGITAGFLEQGVHLPLPEVGT